MLAMAFVMGLGIGIAYMIVQQNKDDQLQHMAYIAIQRRAYCQPSAS